MQQPLEIPSAIAKRQVPNLVQPPPADARVMGTERITVPAGTFQAKHLRSIHQGVNSDVWLSTKVPVWNILRSRMGPQTMELIAYGDEAVSKIVGTPGTISKDTLKFFQSEHSPRDGGLP